MQRKKSFCSNFFSRSVKKSLPEPQLENASFLSRPDTRGTTSSQVQRIPSSSYRVPMASDHMIQTATEENVKLDLDGLITHISKLFDFREGKISSYNPKAAKQYWPTSQSFINLRKLLYDGINYTNNISASAKTVVRGILQSMGSANNIVAVAFLVVANILERIEDVRANKTECLSLLKEMTKLAKVIKEFKERAHFREKMHDEIKEATTLILEGSLMCCTQIDSSKFSKFFNTTVNKDELIKIKKDLDNVYRDLQNKMGFYILDNTEKISEKINLLSTQKEVPDQRRAYQKHPGDVPVPPPGTIIIYAQTVNLQTGALPPSTGYPEYPSRLQYPAPAQVPNTKSQSIMALGRARSNVEKTWQQEQGQCVLHSEQGSSARSNDRGDFDDRKTKETYEKKERETEDKKTKAKNDKKKTEEEDVKRAREAETKKPPTAVQPQKSQNSEEPQRKKDKPEEWEYANRRDPGLKKEPLTYRAVNWQPERS